MTFTAGSDIEIYRLACDFAEGYRSKTSKIPFKAKACELFGWTDGGHAVFKVSGEKLREESPVKPGSLFDSVYAVETEARPDWLYVFGHQIGLYPERVE